MNYFQLIYLSCSNILLISFNNLGVLRSIIIHILLPHTLIIVNFELLSKAVIGFFHDKKVEN